MKINVLRDEEMTTYKKYDVKVKRYDDLQFLESV